MHPQCDHSNPDTHCNTRRNYQNRVSTACTFSYETQGAIFRLRGSHIRVYEGAPGGVSPPVVIPTAPALKLLNAACLEKICDYLLLQFSQLLPSVVGYFPVRSDARLGVHNAGT